MRQTKINIIFLLAVATVLTACLKERIMNTDPDKSPSVVEFANSGDNVASGNSKYPGFYKDLGSLGAGGSATFNLNVAYSGPDDAPEDITVNIALDPGLLSTYNTENGTHYEAPPASVASFPSSLVIKKGTRMAQGKVTITNSPAFDYGKTYALPLQISSTSKGNISSNFGKAVYAFGLRNMYDGTYTLKGQFYHPTPANQGHFTVTVEMHTTGPNTVKMYFPDFGGYYHPWTSGGAITAFGAQEPAYTIDPVTNKVTVQNSYSGAVTFYTMAPGYNSRYDPATKTIYAKWGYNYSPGPTFNPAANREWTDTLIYVGPR